ncbi:MAG: DNA polymerase III subunit alpha [bacterium]|nr:DNA polymerase III subunit alpha [bacterium]
MQKSPFIHLHVHSMYSLSDAMGDVGDIVGYAKEQGYDALALTDHAGLYGAVSFFQACKKAEIKPIIGVEANIAQNRMTDRRARIDSQMHHLTLLAETNEGYKNLLKLVSRSFLEGFYYKARMDKEILRELGKGLIALSGCLKGEIPKALIAHDTDRATELIREYQNIFGRENFFLELVHHPDSPSQIEVNEQLVALSKVTGAPLVATKDVHYLRSDDNEAQDALQCIHDGKLLSDVNRYSISGVDHSLSSPEEMVTAFASIPEAIENTRKIADRCNVEIELGEMHLPMIDVPGGATPDEHLKILCGEGLKERYPDGVSSEATERLAFELETIARMGFASYFLIVSDYVVWAKKQGVVVGPGRGSAAGSIVAYSLKITNLDPLRYGLLFERFLNPDRVSMPDIDLDFDDERRGEVIDYVTQKYGQEHVAGIITFGTMAARASVRDVGRVLGWTFQEVDRVAKAIPPPVQGRHIPLKVSVVEHPELRDLVQSDPRVKELVNLAIRLEGTARHASQHACGIVISPKPLVEYAPLQKAQGGDVEQVTQYSLNAAEGVGLLKMDFLGLSNLTVIRECLEIMKAVHGVTVDVDAIPLDDEETYALLGRGETTGVFQLESGGMKRYIRALKPSQIEDVIAMVALYRPGPMQFIDSFIKRKHKREKITYAHPLLENALANTYGIPVYQEQVMQVSKDMAGFTGGEADTLRKAMGKKIAALMGKMRTKFIEGSVKNGVESKIAEEIFQQFEEFAAYGFNKSHAACYAMIAYQTAYLKAHWPECFMAALLNSDSQNLDRVTIEIEECRHMGLDVLAPDVNESFSGFSVVKGTNTIRFGLHAIKGLGEDVVADIVRERKEKGGFETLDDFISRVPSRVMNRRTLECLVRSGAMDRFGERNSLYYNIEYILSYARERQKETSSGQFNLFAGTGVEENSPMGLHLRPAPLVTNRERLAWERELLGLYVSDHPFRELEAKLGDFCIPVNELSEYTKEKKVRTGGIITMTKKILTKKGEPMLFARIEDTRGDIEAVVFPRVYKERPELWELDTPLVLSGRVSKKDDRFSFLVETAYVLTPENIDQIRGTDQPGTLVPDTAVHGIEEEKIPAVAIHVRASLPDGVLRELRTIFESSPGDLPVYFMIDDQSGPRRIRSSSRITVSHEVTRALESVLGKGTVHLIQV